MVEHVHVPLLLVVRHDPHPEIRPLICAVSGDAQGYQQINLTTGGWHRRGLAPSLGRCRVRGLRRPGHTVGRWAPHGIMVACPGAVPPGIPYQGIATPREGRGESCNLGGWTPPRRESRSLPSGQLPFPPCTPHYVGPLPPTSLPPSWVNLAVVVVGKKKKKSSSNIENPTVCD